MNIEDVISEDTLEYITLDEFEKINGEADGHPEED